MSLYLLEYYYSQIAPSAPRLLNVTASTETSVTLSWMPPDPTNGPLSIYEVTYYEEDDPPDIIIPFFTSFTTFTISSLESSVVYVVNVRASTVAEDNTLIFGSSATLRIRNNNNMITYSVCLIRLMLAKPLKCSVL